MTEPTAESSVQPLDPQKRLDLFGEVVDWLLPLLRPYEAAFYVYFFRRSWITTGQPLVRLSYRTLRTEVVRTPYRREGEPRIAVSAPTVRATLGGLAGIGAIRLAEPATYHGALYRVFLPDEVEACRRRREEKARPPEPPAGVDFYNVKENRKRVYERDNYICHYCKIPLTPFTATLDHVVPVAAGGDNSLANLVSACRKCNARKVGKPIGDFLADRNPM